MNSAALRGRGAKDDDSGGGTDATTAAFLDHEQQEQVVKGLETEALRSAKLWRAVFGAAAVIFGAYFARLMAAMLTLDSATMWVGVSARAACISTPVHLNGGPECTLAGWAPPVWLGPPRSLRRVFTIHSFGNRITSRVIWTR
jgi:hypothetical protein